MNSPPENIPRAEKRLLIVGFGDIAERLSQGLNYEDWLITGLSRSRKYSPYAELQQGDAADTAFLEEVLEQRPEQILVTLTPDERSPQAYADTYLQSAEALIRVCAQLDFSPHIVFVSSTSVYGQDDGSVIDEQSETAPTLFNGQILRAAEKLFEMSRLPLSILRFSGIYGRKPMSIKEHIRAGRGNFQPLRWTNRIHIRDVLGVIKFVLDRYRSSSEPLGCLICSDLHAEQEITIENWLRENLRFSPLQIASSGKSRGKRCNSSRLMGLGYRFAIEDFRVGYREGL